MKKTYQKPETMVISMGAEEAQMAAASVKVNSEVSISSDSQLGAKSHSVWGDDDDEE